MTFNTHWVIVCDMVIGPMNVVEIELKLDLVELSIMTAQAGIEHYIRRGLPRAYRHGERGRKACPVRQQFNGPGLPWAWLATVLHMTELNGRENEMNY